MTVKLVAGLLLVKALTASPLPMPSPQLIVKSQSNLFREQPGRQVDLSQVLPTKELFWLNLEEVGVMHRGSFKLRTRKQLERLIFHGENITQNLSFSKSFEFICKKVPFVAAIVHVMFAAKR